MKPKKKSIINMVNAIQSNLDDRFTCSFTFKNNLVSVDSTYDSENDLKYSIKYLKIVHLLHGLESFCFEKEDIKTDEVCIINDYTVGKLFDLDNQSIIKTIYNQQDLLSVYDTNTINLATDPVVNTDKLYIKFVIEKLIDGEIKEIIYNQSYTQFITKEIFLDLRKINEINYNNLISIDLYFNPNKNKIVTNKIIDDLELILTVSLPMPHNIKTKGYIL